MNNPRAPADVEIMADTKSMSGVEGVRISAESCAVSGKGVDNACSRVMDI